MYRVLQAEKVATAKRNMARASAELLSGHRAMERRDDRFDFQLLCVQLLAESTGDGCRVADLEP